MIRQRKKKCRGCETEQYLFSHGLCKRCWAKAQLEQPERRQNRRSPTKHPNIPPRTKKRSEQELSYTELCAEMDAVPGPKTCFFCGEEIRGVADHHHLIGRDGENLTNKKYLVHAHRFCHTQYHSRSVHKIPWFVEYVNRLSDIDVDLAEKEMEKYNK